jgi:hypothetical protein
VRSAPGFPDDLRGDGPGFGEATQDRGEERLCVCTGTPGQQASAYDEIKLCKLLLEISLLNSGYQRSSASRDDVLTDAAKRYRVDTERLQKEVAEDLAMKRDKKTKGKTNGRPIVLS